MYNILSIFFYIFIINLKYFILLNFSKYLIFYFIIYIFIFMYNLLNNIHILKINNYLCNINNNINYLFFIKIKN